MSTFSRTDWTVVCDHGGCSNSLRTDEIGVEGGSAVDVRSHLEQRGWEVKVHPATGGRWLDYCPDHKGDAVSPPGVFVVRGPAPR